MAELVKMSTPQGTLMYVNIIGQGKLNFNEDGYEYVASQVLGGDAAEEVKAKIQAVYEEGKTAGKNLQSLAYKPCREDGSLYKEDDDDYAERKETPYILLTAKTGVTFKDGRAKKIGVYNSAAQKVSLGDKRVGNGSIGAISGALQYYQNGKNEGVSYWLNSIQLTKFVEYVEDAGFDAQEVEEGGFMGVEDDESGFTGQPEEAEQKAEAPKKAKPRL